MLAALGPASKFFTADAVGYTAKAAFNPYRHVLPKRIIFADIQLQRVHTPVVACATLHSLGHFTPKRNLAKIIAIGPIPLPEQSSIGMYLHRYRHSRFGP